MTDRDYLPQALTPDDISDIRALVEELAKRTDWYEQQKVLEAMREIMANDPPRFRRIA